MNSWQRAVARTADALVAVRACAQAEVDLDVAITARAVVLEHVLTVLDDVAVRPKARAVPIGQHVPAAILETDPLDALARVLRGRARLTSSRAPSELLDASRASDRVTAAWVEVAQRAFDADHAWTHRPRATLPGEQAWHVVAEAASLAQAIAVLDRDLTPQATGRTDVLAVLDSCTGLHLAAREAVTLATAPTSRSRGDATAPATADAAIRDALHVHASREPSLARGVRRLTSLIAGTSQLMPGHIRAAAEVARNLAIVAVREAIDPTGTDLRVELGDLARALHAVTRSNRGEFSLNPVRPRVLELQLHDLHATAKIALASGQDIGTAEATRVARRLPDLVDALASQARAQISSARWAMPDRREDAPLPYAFASAVEPAHQPGIIPPMAAATAAGAALRERCADAVPPSPLAARLELLLSGPDPRRVRHPAMTVPGVSATRRGASPSR